MPKNIELEFIGDITEERHKELKEYFEKNAEFKEKKIRLSLRYFRGNKIPKDINEIKNEELDLRLRITNKKPELAIKYGLFTGIHARKEILIPIDPKYLEDYVESLSLLGWSTVVVYATETYVYKFKDVELSLIYIQDYGYNFEAEILTQEENIKEDKTKIISLLKELKLKPLDENGLKQQCNKLNNKKELQFDFRKQTYSELKNRFKEFFL